MLEDEDEDDVDLQNVQDVELTEEQLAQLLQNAD
jgi:hypothetical protein